MTIRKVVTDDEWRTARQALLAKEKRFTQLRDELTAERQAMPWREVQKDYKFEGENGTLSLADLFADKKQLLVYHFMFAPDWEEGCPSCSFWADNFNGIDVHLAHRDTTLLAIANTSVAKIAAYKKRMGWSFNWVSALGSEFNKDFNVTFSQEEMDKGEMYYNFHLTKFPAAEAPGISVFCQDEAGNIFHTYSTYARGLDMLNGAYHMLDLTPLGRDEKGEGKHNMYWLRRRDSYDD